MVFNSCSIGDTCQKVLLCANYFKSVSYIYFDLIWVLEVLSWDSWYIWRWDLYRVRDKNLISFFYMWLSSLITIILFYPRHIVGHFVKSKVAVWVCGSSVWSHWSVCLFYASTRLLLLLLLCKITENLTCCYLQKVFYCPELL